MQSHSQQCLCAHLILHPSAEQKTRSASTRICLPIPAWDDTSCPSHGTNSAMDTSVPSNAREAQGSQQDGEFIPTSGFRLVSRRQFVGGRKRKCTAKIASNEKNVNRVCWSGKSPDISEESTSVIISGLSSFVKMSSAR